MNLKALLGPASFAAMLAIGATALPAMAQPNSAAAEHHRMV
jgi:hypothetical protein